MKRIILLMMTLALVNLECTHNPAKEKGPRGPNQTDVQAVLLKTRELCRYPRYLIF